MVDYRTLLDALVGALGRQDPKRGSSQEGGGTTHAKAPELLQQARDLAARNPGLTQAALLALAGLMFGRRKKGRLSGTLVRLGGLAVIGGIAYRAFQNLKGPQSLKATPAPQPEALARAPDAGPELPANPPQTSRFHPVSHTEDDALLFLRTMVAAACADGHLDETERVRIAKGLAEAGIDPQASQWLEKEMAAPADVDELAAGVDDPEMAAQVYAAARIAIDPDTIQEREFLNQLASALDLEAAVRTQIDDTAQALR